MILTLMFTLAKLLTKILGHHTGARAVTRMVRVVTWLIVVHLIGRVIWSIVGTKQKDQHYKLCSGARRSNNHIIGLIYLSSAESLPITCNNKQSKALFNNWLGSRLLLNEHEGTADVLHQVVNFAVNTECIENAGHVGRKERLI